MNIKANDEIENKIYNIHDIISIHFKDIVSFDGNKQMILPGFMVFYGNMENLFLTVHDKHFDLFVKRLREVYLKEQNNVVSDELGIKKYIDIDEKSKRILIEGNITEISEIYRFYEKKKGFNESLLISKHEIKSLLPILKYHLEEIIKLFNYNIEYEEMINGYGNNYCLQAKLNNIPIVIPIVYHKNGFNSYTFKVGGILNKVIPIIINITFLNHKLIVESKINEFNLSDYRTYNLTKDGLEEEIYIYFDRKLQRFKKENLEEVSCNYLKLIFAEMPDELKWYLLPWNSIYGYKEEYTPLSDNEFLGCYRSIYFDKVEDHFIINDNYTKKYMKEDTALVDKKDIILDSSSKRTLGVIEDGLITFETSFNNNGVTGFYKDALGGKHFYHGSINTDLDTISKTDLVSLDKKLSNKTDLLRKESIKKYIRRKK